MKMNKCNHYISSFLTPFIDKVPYSKYWTSQFIYVHNYFDMKIIHTNNTSSKYIFCKCEYNVKAN